MERRRLEVDWDSLFPGDVVQIGNTQIDIPPLSLLQLARVTRILKGFGSLLAEQGITWDNYQDQSNIVIIASILLDQFPEVLSEASNIALEDIERLPIDSIVSILSTVIEVNLKSKDNLEKNFKSLTKKLEIMTKKPVRRKPKSVK